MIRFILAFLVFIVLTQLPSPWQVLATGLLFALLLVRLFVLWRRVRRYNAELRNVDARIAATYRQRFP